MSGYERASDKGKSKETITFWAELWRPAPTNAHGSAVISPKFGTEPECVTWVRQRRRDFDQVGMWKRISREGHDYEDIPLDTEEAPLPNPERLHALIADLKKMLDDKKRELDKQPTARLPYSRVGEFNAIERPLTYDEAYPADAPGVSRGTP